MIQPDDILEVMGKHAKNICSKVFPQNRPNASTQKLTEFVVVSLPYAESNKTLGEEDDWWLDMTVVFEIFVADKKSANNPSEYNSSKMKPLRNKAKAIFPIVDKNLGIKITRPRTVVNASSDGNGYHYTRIQAKMTTMV